MPPIFGAESLGSHIAAALAMVGQDVSQWPPSMDEGSTCRLAVKQPPLCIVTFPMQVLQLIWVGMLRMRRAKKINRHPVHAQWLDAKGKEQPIRAGWLVANP